MKKELGLFVLTLMVGGVFMSTTARAETSFSFSVSDGDYHGSHRYHDGPRRPFSPYHHGRSYYPMRYYAPPPVVYVQPAPTVIYESPVVQAPVRYVTESSLVADPASQSYVNETGQLCREYQSMAVVNGRQSQLYGTACLQPDGSWRVVD